MDRTLMKRSRFLALGFAGIITATSPLANAQAANDPVVHSSGSISYVSGGVGDESIGRLNALATKFNLKLVFALKSGEYLSDVQVVIADAKGQTLLDTTSQGPWFLVNLPAGTYDVVAGFAGKTEKRRVTLGSGSKLRTIDFRWNSE